MTAGEEEEEAGEELFEVLFSSLRMCGNGMIPDEGAGSSTAEVDAVRVEGEEEDEWGNVVLEAAIVVDKAFRPEG